MNKVKYLEEEVEKLHDIIAKFILRDLKEYEIPFIVNDDGCIVVYSKDYQDLMSRAKEMGYDEWLLDTVDPIILVVER